MNERDNDLPAPRAHFLGSEPNGLDDHDERILELDVWELGKSPASKHSAVLLAGIGLRLLRASA